jgi:transcriptional regulator with XRE-family HTH domain
MRVDAIVAPLASPGKGVVSDNLGTNLKLLCSHYRSIAEVCRKLAINRAQFNKYLSGQSQPTSYNRKRIGDFFGVEEYELSLPAEQFARLVGARITDTANTPGNDPLANLLQPLREHSTSLSRYCGYYFEYSNCMSVPGTILLSLVHLREERGTFLFERQERQERLASANVQAEDWVRCRYLGAAFHLQDRVFLIDYESLTFNEMSQTILIPSYKSRITRLNGLKTGVSSGDRRTPACTRVVWEFLGEEINRVNAFRQVMLYRPDDPRIDEDIRQRLTVGPISNGLFEIE